MKSEVSYSLQRVNVFLSPRVRSSLSSVVAAHRRRSLVNFGAKTFLPENMCMKMNKMPEFYIFYLREKIKKYPHFINVCPRKIFPHFFLGGGELGNCF